MSEVPKTPAGEMTERIMLSIVEHIRPGGDGKPGSDPVHHYNRAWEKVHALLSEVPVVRESALPLGKRCSRLNVFAKGSFKPCNLPKGHEGKCQP